MEIFNPAKIDGSAFGRRILKKVVAPRPSSAR
jgi:hypothetical protein